MSLSYELGYYVELVIKSKFPQFQLLSPDKFCQALGKRDIHITTSSLEYYDEKGIIRPCLRLNRPIINQGGEKYGFVSIGRPSSWKKLYDEGLLEFPKDGDFQSWSNYGKEDKTLLYYHPFQMLFVKNLMRGNKVSHHLSFFEYTDIEPAKYFQERREQYKTYLENAKKRSKEDFTPIVGLLILLEEPYRPAITNLFWPIEDDDNSYQKWLEWKEKEFSAKKLLTICGLTETDVKKWYERLVWDADHMDPLSRWSPLPSLIRRGKKRKLLNDALLAQDMYEAAKMLALFIKDLTGEQMPEPDETGIWIKGWKEFKYGDPFDPKDKKIQKKILEDFLIDRPITTAIVYEGPTEDRIIKKILEAVYVYEPEKIGLHLYCADGSGNISTTNLDGYIRLAELEAIDIYVIVDKDAEAILEEHLRLNTISKDKCTIWDKDFESANLDLKLVVQKINELLKGKSISENITEEEVEKERTDQKRKLIDAIHSVVYQKTKLELELNIISKPDLVESILTKRISDIRKEYLNGEWKPLLPIEKVLKPILRTIPKYVDNQPEWVI